MEKEAKYAIGEQDFKLLRESGSIYIDKTPYIHKLIASGAKYYFLARPRRFGKSLFLSTLRYFFEGKRDLFKGLYIDSINWEWEEYPVLRLDLNMERYAEPGKLNSVLDYIFEDWETRYDVKEKYENHAQRFANIIKTAHEKTGKQVVILVDEYDKPLVGNLNKNENFEHYREKLASIYSNFKSSAEHIRLVFLTGVSRFSKLSVFSDLNNIVDITFDNDFADICGITEKELQEKLREGVGKLAWKEKVTFETALWQLKKNYDGYRFAEEGSDIYNPWSLLNCLYKSEISNYWNHTGYPSIIVESLKRINADLSKTLDTQVTKDELRGMDLLTQNPTALMYQTGYLTIKSYNKKIKRYRLSIPNEEVKKGFFDMLVPLYVTTKRKDAKGVIDDIVMYFILGQPDDAMKCLQAYFAGVDYGLKMDNENNFHNAFFLLTNLIGLETEAEVHTSDGRIDIVIKTEDFIYIIELKYDHSAEEALRQIEDKKYDRPYQTDGRQIIKIGVSFSSETRCIEGWKIR